MLVWLEEKIFMLEKCKWAITFSVLHFLPCTLHHTVWWAYVTLSNNRIWDAINRVPSQTELYRLTHQARLPGLQFSTAWHADWPAACVRTSCFMSEAGFWHWVFSSSWWRVWKGRIHGCPWWLTMQCRIPLHNAHFRHCIIPGNRQ